MGQRLYFEKSPDLKGKYDVLRKELLSSGGAIAVAESSSSATENNYFADHFEWEGKSLKPHAQSFALTAVTPEYGKTVGWQFVDGRDFSRNFPTANKAVIVNEAAVKYTGLRHPVGKTVRWNNNLFAVIGVINDMVKGSPYKPFQQSLFFMAPDIGPEITIRLNPRLSAAKSISEIEPVFKRLNYEYRTHLSWWIFAATGIVVLLITLLTVSAHVIKAAVANPVKRLRTE